MNWRLAVGRAWKLPVVWEAEDEPQAAITAPQVVIHVHYYVPAPGIGSVAAAPAVECPAPRKAIEEAPKVIRRRSIGQAGR